MTDTFLQNIQKRVAEWQIAGYPGAEKETLNILSYINRVAFLHKPQIEALETYIYLKEIVGNKSSLDVFRSFFTSDKELLLGLGVSKDKAFDLIGNEEEINKCLEDAFGSSDYVNQVYALTMGSGKTILMAAMIVYDFVLSYYHPDDERFAKNVLVFAPDTTIIESLKEIKTFDYAKVLPREYQNVLLNIKYHYLESTETPLSPIGNYNVIVANSQKIILKTRGESTANHTKRLFGDKNEIEKREVENRRLQAIRQLARLAIFVDEAHHSYGKTLEGTLKKTRQTIEYLHKSAPLVSVINLTGTPYVSNKMIADVVYHFGLKAGIEQGILKQVRILDYGTVRSEQFLEDVIGTFVDEYGTRRLEGRLPKMAFYAASIDDLKNDLRPKLERILARKDIPLHTVLEYHTEAEENRDVFLKLDTGESDKQFVLLVGKGTEGWNCRSLVAVALYKKPKSTILVLQSTTRCLRAIGDNSTRAHIFLSKENYKILDRELKSNFSSSVEEINAQDQKTVEHTLKVEKRKRVKVKKVLKEIVAAERTDAAHIKIDFKKFKPEDYRLYVKEGGIFVGDAGRAGYKEAIGTRHIVENDEATYYEIVELINRHTHLPFLVIDRILSGSGKARPMFVDEVNRSPALVPFIIHEVLKSAYKYEERTQTIEEELELTKMYPFKISIQHGKNKLIIYRETEEEGGYKSRLGFHVNPYNFDSADEKDLFRYLRNMLDDKEAIKDVYFTGGATDTSHNDFYFEYWSPERQCAARYFPDFLIETTSGRFLVVEVKSNSEKMDYEANRRSYSGKREELTNEIFAKEIGFREFQETNKNFEYRIVFNALLQQEQTKLFEEMAKL
ncbi:MAG: DEAD/DEAH box helicase family protein [Minisyncoccia bacterium]